MSIQSEITRIQNEVSTQNGLIGQVSAKLQEKGATVTNTAGSSVTIANNTTKLQDVLAMAATIPEGVELPELTTPATAADLRSGKELIDADGNKITGTMPDSTQSDITITVNTSGRVTAKLTQTEGHVAEATIRGATQLSTQAAKTVTPTESSQTAVASGRYTTGAITVAAIPAQYITTTDATATAADMRSGKTGYVNGSKVTGTMADFDGSYEASGDSSSGITINVTGDTTLHTAGKYCPEDILVKVPAGGGASLDTCTVTIYGYNVYGKNVWFVAIDDNGSITTQNVVFNGYIVCEATCWDVVCGSLIIIDGINYSTCSVDGTAELIFASENYSVFKAPTVAGEACGIS